MLKPLFIIDSVFYVVFVKLYGMCVFQLSCSSLVWPQDAVPRLCGSAAEGHEVNAAAGPGQANRRGNFKTCTFKNVLSPYESLFLFFFLFNFLFSLFTLVWWSEKQAGGMWRKQNRHHVCGSERKRRLKRENSGK